LPIQIQKAVEEYAREQSLASNTGVEFTALMWDAQYNVGANVTLTVGGNEPITYTVTGDAQYGITLTFRTDENGTDFVCKDL
jgi:hypothetical protein